MTNTAVMPPNSLPAFAFAHPMRPRARQCADPKRQEDAHAGGFVYDVVKCRADERAHETAKQAHGEIGFLAGLSRRGCQRHADAPAGGWRRCSQGRRDRRRGRDLPGVRSGGGRLAHAQPGRHGRRRGRSNRRGSHGWWSNCCGRCRRGRFDQLKHGHLLQLRIGLVGAVTMANRTCHGKRHPAVDRLERRTCIFGRNRNRP